MAGLLDPDFVIGRDGISRRIEPPTDGLLAITTPTWADAWQFNTQAAGDWIGQVKDAVTGESQITDENKDTPEWTQSPLFTPTQRGELAGIYAMTGDTAAVQDLAIKLLGPEARRGTDAHGNLMVTRGGQSAYMDRPGLSQAQLAQAAGWLPNALALTGVGMLPAIGGRMALNTLVRGAGYAAADAVTESGKQLGGMAKGSQQGFNFPKVAESAIGAGLGEAPAAVGSAIARGLSRMGGRWPGWQILDQSARNLPAAPTAGTQRMLKDPTTAANTATGLPTAAGVVDAAGQTAQGILMGSTAPKGIRGYHGSPHDFPPTPRNPLGEFDPSKIGTGEGEQAYGVGAAYIAEREGNARWYRDQLSPGSFERLNWGTATPEQVASSAAEHFGSREAAARWLTDEAPMHDYGDPGGKLEQAVSVLNSKAPLVPLKAGKMYEVNIKADPEHFLHWDKPLGEQSPEAREALGKLNYPRAEVRPNSATYGGYGVYKPGFPAPYQSAPTEARAAELAAQVNDRMRGEDVYRALAQAHGSSAASAALQDAGIPGIRYLDQGSRDAGQGSHNYVVFDAAKIEILRKYLALLTAGGAGGMAAIGGRSD